MPARPHETILFLCPDSEWNGMHPGAWRASGSIADRSLDFPEILRIVRRAEDAAFHGVFIADLTGFRYEVPLELLARTASAVRFEPFVLMSALAASTSRIGLVLTAGTTYDEPFHVARRFASLDHLSGGRSGWNVVTTGNQAVAARFGADKHLDHEVRYARGAEFVEAVLQLWDTFEDDAFLRDAQSGHYLDPRKIHPATIAGDFITIDGPLNVARPPQGYPVIAQAGSSPTGRAFAVRFAEVIFTMQPTMESARRFRESVREEAAAIGRDPDSIKVLAGLTVLIAESDAAAAARFGELDALVDPDLGLAILSSKLDMDLGGLPLDGPLPAVAETERGTKSVQGFFVTRGREHGLTIRQLISDVLRWGAVSGAPSTIADHIEEWIVAGAADGFNLTFADLPNSFDWFVDHVVPELRRRHLFRDRFSGVTLRENLGLGRPANRYLTGARHA